MKINLWFILCYRNSWFYLWYYYLLCWVQQRAHVHMCGVITAPCTLWRFLFTSLEENQLSRFSKKPVFLEWLSVSTLHFSAFHRNMVRSASCYSTKIDVPFIIIFVMIWIKRIHILNVIPLTFKAVEIISVNWTFCVWLLTYIGTYNTFSMP